jgi:hypothetical protein
MPSVHHNSSSFWDSKPSVLADNLSLSAMVLFHVKISKTIASYVGTGGSARCDEVPLFYLLHGKYY